MEPYFTCSVAASRGLMVGLFVLILQIKAKLKVAFKNDVMSYNSSDSSSSVVDTIQQSVSGRFAASLMVLLLSVSPWATNPCSACLQKDSLKG